MKKATEGYRIETVRGKTFCYWNDGVDAVLTKRNKRMSVCQL